MINQNTLWFRGRGLGTETNITNGIDNSKLNIGYKLGALQMLIWSILGWTGLPGTLGSTTPLTSSSNL